jgi:hypothetical protein
MTTSKNIPLRRIVLFALAVLLLGAAYALVPSASRYTEAATILLRVAFVLWALLFFPLVIKLGAAFLIGEGSSSPVTSAVARDGIIGTIWEIYRRHAFPRSRLWLLFVFWSVVVFGIVCMLSATGRLDDAEVYVLEKLALQARSYSTTTSRILVLETGDNNPTDYLRDLAQVVGDLKTNGARAVVARFPPLVATRPLHDVLIDSIMRSGIAVLYRDYWRSRQIEYPLFVGGGKGMFRAVTPILVPVPVEGQGRAGLFRWYPCDSTSDLARVDATIMAAAKYRGFPDTLRATITPESVTYGNVSVPVNAHGQACVLWRLGQPAGEFLTVSAVRELDSDTLRFFSYPEWRSFGTYPAEFGYEVRDRIVFVEWIVPGTRQDWRKIAYANIVENLLRDEAVREFERVHLYIAALVVLLSAVLSLTLRPGVAAFLIAAAGVVLLLGSAYALVALNVLVQGAYPAAAAFISAVILPLVRLSHEHP